MDHAQGSNRPPKVEPWVSSEDISKGQRWAVEIAERLDSTDQGIVCVTRANIAEPWLNFEAGALAKSFRKGQVRTLLLDIEAHEVAGPLAEFQASLATSKEDMRKFVESLNAGCARPLPPERLASAFAKSWSDFEERLSKILENARPPRGVSRATAKSRTTEDMLDEVLARLRLIERRVSIREVDIEAAGLRTPRMSSAASASTDKTLVQDVRSAAYEFDIEVMKTATGTSTATFMLDRLPDPIPGRFKERLETAALTSGRRIRIVSAEHEKGLEVSFRGAHPEWSDLI